MNGLSFSELCCLFCCPPCPGRIASKLAFLPPECSYELKPDEASASKYTLGLYDKADWQYGDSEKEYFETFYSRSSRGNRIACLFVRCSTNARYVFTTLFSFELPLSIFSCIPSGLHFSFRTAMPSISAR